MHQTSPLRAILSYALVGTPIAVLVFLFATRFFVSWDGHVVGMQPYQAADPEWYTVLVVEPDRNERRFQWKAEIVEGREIPITQILAPPPTIPDEAIHTQKSRFSLHYLIQRLDGGHDLVPTTTPQALVLALLVWVLGLLLRNMIYAGSPFSLASRPTVLPRALPPAGQVAPGQGPRSKKGPPPPRPSKGQGRRR